jgi:hypothetical protein
MPCRQERGEERHRREERGDGDEQHRLERDHAEERALDEESIRVGMRAMADVVLQYLNK